MESGGLFLARAKTCHERVRLAATVREGEEKLGRERERETPVSIREFKTDMSISLTSAYGGGDSRTLSFPLKGRSLASIARL